MWKVQNNSKSLFCWFLRVWPMFSFDNMLIKQLLDVKILLNNLCHCFLQSTVIHWKIRFGKMTKNANPILTPWLIKTITQNSIHDIRIFVWFGLIYKNVLTINSICSFWQCNSIWGGGTTPPLRSRKPLDVWPWNFYQMSSPMGRHEIQKDFWHNSSGL